MRFKINFTYNGANFFGSQKQLKFTTIQTKIEHSLFLLTKQKIILFFASRTDKGVHALQQVAHFDLDIIKLPFVKFKNNWNKLLFPFIKISSIKKTNSNFHARFSAKSKIYLYKISKKQLNPFNSCFLLYLPQKIDIILAQKLMNLFIGTFDFSAFTSNAKEQYSTIKTIYSFTIKETKNNYLLEIHGNSFLKYMIRNIIGNLLAVLNDKKPINHLQTMLQNKNNTLSVKKIAAAGLYLKKIIY